MSEPRRSHSHERIVLPPFDMSSLSSEGFGNRRLFTIEEGDPVRPLVIRWAHDPEPGDPLPPDDEGTL